MSEYTLPPDEQENAKNGRRIFWFVVTLFGVATAITLIELWMK